MRVYKDKSAYHKYAWEFAYDQSVVDFIHDELQQRHEGGDGWRLISFDKEAKKWRFSELWILSLIQQRYPHVEVELDSGTVSKAVEQEAVVSTYSQQLDEANKVKERGTPLIEVRGVKQPLYDYQKLGVEFLTAAGGRAILADAPGVGKTAQTLAFLVHNKIEKTLVICPASVKYSWENEAKKWTNFKPFVIDSRLSKKSITDFTKIISEFDIFIVNYDLLKKYFPIISNLRFDCLVLDEFHAIKSNTAQRTKLTKAIAKKIPKVVLLSGTPILNRPSELYNGLNILDPIKWGNWMAYIKRYCGAYMGRWGLDLSGATNLDELHEKIKPYFLRRTKQEVLKELPPKNFIQVPVRLSATVESMYKRVEEDLAKFLLEYRDRTVEEVKKSLAAEKLVKLNELRQLTTVGKLETAQDLITQLVENQEKVIVFSVYNAPLEELHRMLGGKSVLLTGKTQTSERGEMVRRFQEDDQIKVFLGGTKAAGVGITLTAASNVVFLDYDWTPAIMEQAADRAHRIGQSADSVNIYELYARDTIDDYMAEILAEKKSVVSKIIDGKDTEDQQASTVNTIFKNIERKYSHGN